MADTKISALTALTGANVDPVADVFPIVDTSVTTTKKILVSELGKALTVHKTEIATTSGTSADFTGIPAGTKRITVMFVGVSTNGTNDLVLTIGDAGGLETSGYSSGATNFSATTTSTAAFVLSRNVAAGDTRSGSVTLTLEDASDFTWVSTGILLRIGTSLELSTGSKALSAELTQLSVSAGGDTFDAGAINVLYEI